jgi:RNA polymerase sigma factor (sigma-70 family)
MQIDPQDLHFASMVIASETKSLGRRGLIRDNDAENFASELMARLLANWHTYDPQRGPREAFVNVVVSSQSTSLRREMNAQKRRGHTHSVEPIADQLADRAASEAARRHHTNLKLDLASVVTALTPIQQQLVVRLQRDPLTTIAKRLGVPRRTLRDRCDRIRDVFRDAGLEVYL